MNSLKMGAIVGVFMRILQDLKQIFHKELSTQTKTLRTGLFVRPWHPRFEMNIDDKNRTDHKIVCFIKKYLK